MTDATLSAEKMDLETLEAKAQRLEEALEQIDAVALDFGYFESAARTMKEIAEKALYGGK